MDEKESTRELVVVDVKHYKKVKKALHESEERYRKLFENIPIGIYRTTAAGQILNANPALLAMLGFSSFAELATKNVDKDFWAGSYSRAAFIAQLERDGEIKGLESLWVKKDGTPIYVRENAKLIRSDDGQVVFEGTVEDVSVGKLAEEAQKTKNKQLEILNLLICSANQADSLPEFLGTILDQVTMQLGFEIAAIYLFEADSKSMMLKAHKGLAKEFLRQASSIVITDYPFSQTLSSRQSLFVGHLRDAQPPLAKKWHWRSVACIPLVCKGLIIGTLNVASGQRSDFSDSEKEILDLIGKEAGTLISKLQTETALHESEKYYRTLIELSPDIIAVMDLDAKLLTVNQRFLQCGGYYYDEVIGFSAYDFISGLDHVFLKKKTNAFVKKSKVSKSEYLFKKKNGQTISMEVSASLLSDGQGKPKGIIAIGRDVSERKHNEEMIRKNEETFRCTFEAIPDPAYIWTCQNDGRFILSRFNRAAARVTKNKMKLFLGIEPERLFAAYPDFIQRMESGLKKGENQSTELLYTYQSTGKSRWLQVDFAKTADHSVLVITKDITERKRAEQELRESKALIDAVVENVPIMIFVKEATDLKFVIFNRAGEELLGYDRASLLGKNNLDLFPAEQSAFFMAKDREVLSGKADILDIPEEPIMTARKGQRLLHTRKVCIRGADGATKYLLGISEDITERKEAEAKLLAYQEQLRALTSEMMLVEERERRRIATELHDQIGQNLALCKLKVAALGNDRGNDGLKVELEGVNQLLENCIQGARSLIFDLSPPVLYELGFPEAMEWLAERIQEQFSIPVEFSSKNSGFDLDTDQKVLLFQIVREMLINVGKHSQATQAWVILTAAKSVVTVEVKDNGIGFEVLQPDSQKKQGAAFGFFSVRERLNFLGGVMEIKSRPGEGTHIVVSIPSKKQANLAGRKD